LDLLTRNNTSGDDKQFANQVLQKSIEYVKNFNCQRLIFYTNFESDLNYEVEVKQMEKNMVINILMTIADVRLFFCRSPSLEAFRFLLTDEFRFLLTNTHNITIGGHCYQIKSKYKETGLGPNKKFLYAFSSREESIEEIQVQMMDASHYYYDHDYLKESNDDKKCICDESILWFFDSEYHKMVNYINYDQEPFF
jgi:hypothetical protein